ncbi:MAG: cation:proton antiporter [Dehalococcoidia bacterium]
MSGRAAAPRGPGADLPAASADTPVSAPTAVVALDTLDGTDGRREPAPSTPRGEAVSPAGLGDADRVAHSELLFSLVAALVAAFAGGLLAARLRLPTIVGYLLAGIVVGPNTPGLVADPAVAAELAEVGVILLMFGVGIHFSLRDLLRVRDIAVPGALGQVVVATFLGGALARWWGWSWGGALVLGLAISVASTVVLLRALEDRGALASAHGRIAVGWLIVEDLFTVVALVMLPALAVPLGGSAEEGLAVQAGAGNVALTLALALAKSAAFVAIMLLAGARAVPWLLVRVARTGSRDLFTLGVLAVALGIAFVSAELFGVSLALGAFLAGLVVSESDLSHQAAADALPLRDAFAVLFFVSVGMLFDPRVLLSAPLQVVALLLIVLVGKGLTAFLIVAVLRYPPRAAVTVAVALAQIGEFSFILAGLGRALGLLPEEGTNLILAVALLSITANPLLFGLVDPLEARLRGRWPAGRPRGAGSTHATDDGTEDGPLRGHVIVCGYGRVGAMIAGALARRGFTYVVVEQDRRRAEALRREGVTVIWGDAANPSCWNARCPGRPRRAGHRHPRYSNGAPDRRAGAPHLPAPGRRGAVPWRRRVAVPHGSRRRRGRAGRARAGIGDDALHPTPPRRQRPGGAGDPDRATRPVSEGSDTPAAARTTVASGRIRGAANWTEARAALVPSFGAGRRRG